MSSQETMRLDASFIAESAKRYGVPEIAVAVRPEVHISDKMFNLRRDAESYSRTGASAIAIMRAALSAANRKEARSILDFGCGHGRVGRWIRAAYPEATLVGADMASSAVDFYASTFSAAPWLTCPDLRANSAPQRFDVIWSGSVFTHLPSYSSSTLLEQFLNWLNPDGVAIFTSQGRVGLDAAPTETMLKMMPTLAESELRRAQADFYEGRYGFASFKGQPHYGMSFVPIRWWVDRICTDPFNRLIMCAEGGWADFQDVIVIQRRPEAQTLHTQ